MTEIKQLIENYLQPNSDITATEVNEILTKIEEKSSGIKSNESLSLAQRKGDVLHGILDQYTGEEITLSKVTGAPTVDNIIYFQLGSEYFMRSISKGVNVKWFGAKGDVQANDVGTDDTESIQSAINAVYALPKISLSGGNLNASGRVFLPKGRYKITNTLVLRDGIKLSGDARENTNIHCATQMIAISNIYGMDGINVLQSAVCAVENLTITQGGIEMEGCHDGLVKNVKIMSLTDTYALKIQLSVNMNVENVKVFDSYYSGYAVQFTDYAGSGPSTTTKFNNLWVAHCLFPMIVNGLDFGSHEIQSSSIQNSIFEYNGNPILFTNRINGFLIKNIHFEQNPLGSLKLANGDFNISLEDIYDDTGFIDFTASNVGSMVTVKNVKPEIRIDAAFLGESYFSGNYNISTASDMANVNIRVKTTGEVIEGYLTKFSGLKAIAKSIIYERIGAIGTAIGIGTIYPERRFHLKETVGYYEVARFESVTLECAIEMKDTSGLLTTYGTASGDFFIGINGVKHLLIDRATGNVNILSNVKSKQFILSSLNTPPANATDTGVLGEIRYTSDYMYVCVASNTWKRSALTTW